MKRFLFFIKNFFKIIFEWLFVFLYFLSFYLAIVIPVDIPIIEDMSSMDLKIEYKDGMSIVENSWQRKNNSGFYEVYIEGAPFERGVKYGKLILESNEIQEGTFVNQIEKMIPSRIQRFFTNILIGWFNRDLDITIPQEFLKEIYGESFYMSDKYDYVANKFYRILNYHAAHDIGHALQGPFQVGCTSFALNGNRTKDEELILGRNFDFYVGKEFAQQKLILIVNPEEGHRFVSYSWPGFLGVVSGMNEHGLTVTLNASKSKFPSGAKVPISILAREILQYAKTIEEAYEICKKREVFVSESLLIGSAIDNRAAIIEKSPSGYDIYDPNEETLICSNHYQSEFFKNSEINKNNIEYSDSKYRYDRVAELLSQKEKLNYQDVAAILRNYLGKNDEFIGYGNQKSINQFTANHAVIFKPQQKLMWVSTSPYQMGEFICYDLNKIFTPKHANKKENYLIDSLLIPADPFSKSKEFQNFQLHKDQKEAIIFSIISGQPLNLNEEEIKNFINFNPESYDTYMVLGMYFRQKENVFLARSMFEKALTKSVASKQEIIKIEKYIEDL